MVISHVDALDTVVGVPACPTAEAAPDIPQANSFSDFATRGLSAHHWPAPDAALAGS